MTNSNLGKQGIHVLACLTSEPLSLPCSMRIFYDQPCKQVTIALRTSLVLYGYTGEQTFIAQIDADNLLPGSTAVDSATIHLRDEQRSILARNADPKITTLSLNLTRPCPLWCPRADILVPVPEPSAIASFNELVALAKATTVHIVFDYKWLHKDAQTAFRRLAKGKERLHSYPLEKFYAKPLKRRDWTIFTPPDDISTPPPGPAEPSNKRPRQTSISTSLSPPSKRKVLGKAQPPSHAASPTECASSPPAYPKDNDEDEDEGDFQQQAITRVVRRHLPTILKDILPDVIAKALPPLLALHSSLASSFDSSHDSQTPDLTPLGASLVPHILAHIEPQLLKINARALSSAFRRREEAALEFEEDFEYHKADLIQIREDAIDDLQREATDALHLVKEKGTDWADEFAEEVDSAVRSRLDALRVKALHQAKLDRQAAHDFWSKYSPGGRQARRHATGVRRTCLRFGGKGGYRGLGQRWRAASLIP